METNLWERIVLEIRLNSTTKRNGVMVFFPVTEVYIVGISTKCTNNHAKRYFCSKILTINYHTRSESN